MHIILVHVEQVIDLTGKTLGQFSEQALEDVHSLFQMCWTRLLVKEIDSKIYLSRYHACILTFNSENV